MIYILWYFENKSCLLVSLLMVEIYLVNASTTTKDYSPADLTCRMLQDARHFVELTKKNVCNQKKKKSLK